MNEPSPAHEQVLTAIRRIIRAIDLHSRQLIQHHGLTGPQLIILRRMASEGETAIGELAEAVSLSHPTVTGILARMEKRGLIRRTRGERDKRQYLVRITDEGRKLLDQAPPLLREHFTKQFEKLQDWEQMQILSSLQRIVDMMEAREIPAAPQLISGQFSEHEGEAIGFLSDMIGGSEEAKKRKKKG